MQTDENPTKRVQLSSVYEKMMTRSKEDACYKYNHYRLEYMATDNKWEDNSITQR